MGDFILCQPFLFAGSFSGVGLVISVIRICKKACENGFFVDLVPTACNILFIIVVGLYGFSTGDEAGTTFIVLFMLIVMVIVNVIIFIWIIVRIVKVATNKM
ncbi:hypothetical protein HCI99_00760 [Listeria booriae]|uniref:Uncharacterized protein n=1 Tax=Listeria booriae TaxID=1552123 RepID=A0A7X0X9Z6_9LIST|nr:hypothetical protein [Listeria booriae]MBC1490350.1 hypothetical protein [Listeria booriae]